MTNIDVITTSGSKNGSVALKKAKKASGVLVATVAVANMANKRQSIAHTKTKGEVSGGGKKPWRQKGTGRARAGSSRSPLWIGGGTTFGPRSNRNFSKRFNKKQGVSALYALISEKAENGELKIIDELKLAAPKTKEMTKFLAGIGIDGSSLLVLDQGLHNGEDALNIYISGRNLPYLNITSVDKLSVVLVMKSKYLIITKKAFEFMNAKFDKLGKEEK